jgi:hypothetical protein
MSHIYLNFVMEIQYSKDSYSNIKEEQVMKSKTLEWILLKTIFVSSTAPRTLLSKKKS